MMSFGTPTWQPWLLGEAEGIQLVSTTLDLGITFFDTADAYSAGLSEEILGRALRACGALRNTVIATKTGLPIGDAPGGLRPERMAAALDASLRRLGVDHVDLWQLHGWDPAVPIEEVMGAMAAAVQAGKALHLGASNFTAWQFALANSGRRPTARLASMQLQHNLLYREEKREMLPLCRHSGIGAIAYSPLARGRLAGEASTASERRRASTDAKAARLYGGAAEAAVIRTCAQVADARGLPPAQIALAWALATPGIDTLIIGATEPRHLHDAVAALTIDLQPEERSMLEAAYRPRLPEHGDLSGTVR